MQKEKKKRVEREKGETEKGREQRTDVERKRGLEQRIFQHLFSFKSSQKNYGEFGFNF